MRRLFILLMIINAPFIMKSQQSIENLYGEWNNYRVIDACGNDHEPWVETKLIIEPFISDSIRLTLNRDLYEEETTNVFLEATSNENEWTFEAYFEDYLCLRNITFIENDSIVVKSQCACLACHCGGNYFFTKAMNTSFSGNIGTDDWEIYPNPVSDKLTISSPFTENSESKIRIYNCVGNLVEFIDVNSEYTIIDLSNLLLGIYYIEIITKTGKAFRKIVKI